MANAYVQVLPDGVGKRLQTFQNTIGGAVVQAEGVVHVDANGVALGSAAAFLETNQVAASTTAATLVIARPTRRAVSFKNLSASVTVYVGAPTVTALNGMELKPGESIAFQSVGLIQVIAVSGAPRVAYADEYD